MAAIAKRLGVSKTTVHYALRNTGRVSQAMREKVRAMARELGYRPNRLARSLRTKRTDTLGVVLSSLRTTFHASLLEGIEGQAQEKEFGVLLAISGSNFETERQRVELLLEKAVDGLIVSPCSSTEGPEFYDRLIERGVKVVFADRHLPEVQVDAVSTDNKLGGYLATKHLIDCGRRSIAFLHANSLSRCASSAADRCRGWKRAHAEAGLRPGPIVGPNVPDQATDEEYAALAIESYLASGGPEVDAVFAAHDGLAVGAINTLVRANRRVPADVAVVGFDDQHPSAFVNPPLTTIRQPGSLLGREAARILFRRLDDSAEPEMRQRFLFDPALVVRESCGAIRGDVRQS